MFTSLILLSLISIVFGVLVFAQPEIIAYLVASFFIITGLVGLITAYQSKRFWNRFKNNQ
jgi:uncharacterized membrane protein HdeD (DUF308 family)